MCYCLVQWNLVYPEPHESNPHFKQNFFEKILILSAHLHLVLRNVGSSLTEEIETIGLSETSLTIF